MMRKWLLLFCLLSPLTWGSEQDARNLGELSSHSRLLCASAMVYFNPQEREPDPRALSATFYHLNTLSRLVVQLGNPEALQSPVQAMEKLFKTLDGLPRDQASRFPELVGQLLEQERRLEHAAQALSAGLKQDPAGDPGAPFNAQSQALASLLLDYQLRAYPLPNKLDFALPEAQAARLDADIEQRFDQLLADHPDHADVLGKARTNYRFVRAQLQQGGGRTHGGAEFYLSRAVVDLDELAVSLN
ncbi:hypothetical protein [Pseudomonas sp. LFM046]|uniref:hypothetical protein n=1 Tax=Pseudomonas sp. LFM046 TaxID=1608357 RepID=UPI0005CFDC66|nr:hypothetical protein [Pseudomonas sp. LFM046]